MKNNLHDFEKLRNFEFCLMHKGGLPEWLNGTVSKTVIGVTLSRVRISHPPLKVRMLRTFLRLHRVG